MPGLAIGIWVNVNINFEIGRSWYSVNSLVGQSISLFSWLAASHFYGTKNFADENLSAVSLKKSINQIIERGTEKH